jgi:hypothetical protein
MTELSIEKKEAKSQIRVYPKKRVNKQNYRAESNLG